MFTLTPTDNNINDAGEVITISNTDAQVVDSATITLYDDEFHRIVLSVSPTVISETAGATPVTLTATSNFSFTDHQVLSISVSGSGEASAVDFAEVPEFDLTLRANETAAEATFILTPTDDQVNEIDETVTITSSNPLVTDSATITLRDDELAPYGVLLSVAPNNISEGDGSSLITVTGILNGHFIAYCEYFGHGLRCGCGR